MERRKNKGVKNNRNNKEGEEGEENQTERLRNKEVNRRR